MSGFTQGPGLLGREVGGYRLDSPLGIDGMARVYRATDPAGHRAVLKLVYKDEGQKCDKESRGASVQQEVQVRCDRLCPRILNAGSIDGDWFFVAMEFIDGEDLARLVEKLPTHRVPIEASLHYIKRLLIKLAALHEVRHGCSEVLHRDIKPSNLLVDRNNDIVLLDFGLAKYSGSETDQFFGVIEYFSPDRYFGAPDGPHIDLWGAAIVFYQMLSGGTPWVKKEGENEGQFMARVRAHGPYDTRLPADTPRGVADVIGKALAQNIGGRFSSAKDFASAVESLQARSLRTTRTIGKPDDSSATPSSVPMDSFHKVRRGVVGLIQFGLAGSVGWFGFQEYQLARSLNATIQQIWSLDGQSLKVEELGRTANALRNASRLPRGVSPVNRSIQLMARQVIDDFNSLQKRATDPDTVRPSLREWRRVRDELRVLQILKLPDSKGRYEVANDYTKMLSAAK